jgi:hypothetical protein
MSGWGIFWDGEGRKGFPKVLDMIWREKLVFPCAPYQQSLFMAEKINLVQ